MSDFRTKFRRFRIAVLLAILAFVAITTWFDRRRIMSWKKTLVVGVYPIAGDDYEETKNFVAGLEASAFADIEPFFAREANRYGIDIPGLIEVRAGPSPGEQPPPPPSEEDRSALSVALWSLHFRWWVFRASWKYDLGDADVRMFAIYHRPVPGTALEHSLGIARVRAGIAHLFAGDREQATNNVVLVHEVLHVAGATDKYDASGKPAAPHGLAEPL